MNQGSEKRQLVFMKVLFARTYRKQTGSQTTAPPRL